MFGSLGFNEILFIMVLALLIFGPKRLPQIGRTIGKTLGEFRRATSDLKRSMEVEMTMAEERETAAGPLTSLPVQTQPRRAEGLASGPIAVAAEGLGEAEGASEGEETSEGPSEAAASTVEVEARHDDPSDDEVYETDREAVVEEAPEAVSAAAEPAPEPALESDEEPGPEQAKESAPETAPEPAQRPMREPADGS